MTFGKRLKIARTESGYNQEYVSEVLGVTRAAYSRYENDLREPTVDYILKLANLFNVSADFLINTNLYNKNAVLNDTEKKLLNIFRDLNEQGQDYLMQTIDMVKDKYIKSNTSSDLEDVN